MSFNFTRFSTSSPLTAASLNANFAAVEARLGAIRNVDFANTAGITSDRLADKYSVVYSSFVLSTAVWGNTGLTNGWNFQDQATRASATHMALYPQFNGKRAYLVGIRIHITGYTATATPNNGVIWIKVNTYELSPVAVQSGSEPATGTLPYTIGGDFADPLMPLFTGDVIYFAFGKLTDSDADNPAATNISVTVAYKVELNA